MVASIKKTIARSSKQSGTLALKYSERLWYCTTFIGQWAFSIYIVSFYLYSAITGNMSRWNTVLPQGHQAREFGNNVAVGMHVLISAYVMMAGILQLLPSLRTHHPRIHRLNGRTYLFTMSLVSLTGLHMVWTHGSALGRVGDISISINALMILVCAGFTLYFAVKRNFAQHWRWALRLFILGRGVWFFRILFSSWIEWHGKPVGFDPATFRGPQLNVLAYAQFVGPWLLVELYFWTTKQANGAKLCFAFILAVCSTITAFGVFTATMILWWPRITS